MATTARLEMQVAGALRRAGYSGNGTTLVVGTSGGPDSSALLHCLHRLSESHELRLHVAHLNHNFRGQEAYDDANFVASLARGLGLDATVEERNVLDYQRARGISSFEQAAREFRYSFLAEVADNVGADAVAVGHTADDLAETVLLHILRGTGTRGLQGMAELSTWAWPRADERLRLFRPLLQATSSDTIQYCRDLGKDYRDDSGNYLQRFTRNRVRLNLLPLMAADYNPRIRESLVRLSRAVSLELDYLDGETERLWEQLAEAEPNAVGFRQPQLASIHPALLKLLLRRAYTHLTGDARRLGERHLDAMARLVMETGGTKGVDLPGGLRFHRSYEYLRLSREPGLPCPFPSLEGTHHIPIPQEGENESIVIAGPWRVRLRVKNGLTSDFPGSDLKKGSSPSPASGPRTGSENQSWTAYLRRDALGNGAQVRTWQPGDRFQPLGMEVEKKLQDFFTDAQVPRDWRGRVPLLVSQRGIAWVVGYRIAHWARVPEPQADSNEVLEITTEPMI